MAQDQIDATLDTLFDDRFYDAADRAELHREYVENIARNHDIDPAEANFDDVEEDFDADDIWAGMSDEDLLEMSAWDSRTDAPSADRA
jgi:hypothetical protein